MAHAGTVASLTGVVDAARGQWLIASRWPALRGLDAGAAIRRDRGEVDVVRQLDAEFRSRALADPEAYAGDVALLHWGWGIGMAYGRDGIPWSGQGGPFGEIGHWRLTELEGRPCGCGQQGCLETGAALWSLLPALRHHWPRLAEDEDQLLSQLRTLDLLSVPEVAAAARLMARAMANLGRLLFPRRLVLSSPLLGNAALWDHVGALFRAESMMRGLALPSLSNEPMPAARGMAGAAGPLVARALEALLKGSGQAGYGARIRPVLP